MIIKLLIISCILCSVNSYLERGHYTIVAPGTMSSNSEYQISFSLDDFTQSCWFNISLEKNGKEFKRATVEIEPRTTKLVKLQLPTLYSGYGALKVIGYRGIICNETASITINQNPYMVLIQTSKHMYLPGELIQFRVLFMDRLTRPVQINEVVDVDIFDGTYNLIRKFSNITIIHGVFKGDFQLSDPVSLREWSIRAGVSGVFSFGRSFYVVRYVLPKFSVEIDIKKEIGFNEKKMAIRVKSSYTYDQPVNGNLTVVLKLNGLELVLTKEYDFDGKTELWLDFESDLGIIKDSFKNHSPNVLKYLIEATVTEALTGQSRSAKSETNIYLHAYNLKIDAPQSFVDEDVLNITISVTDLQGHPIADSTNPVNITVRPWSFRSNISNSEKEAKSSVYLEKNGVGVVSLKAPKDEEFPQDTLYYVRAHYLGYDPPRVLMKKDLVQGGIGLEVLTKSPEVGKELLIQVNSKEPIEQFIYEIVSRGHIIQSQRISGKTETATHLLRLNVTYDMVPKSKLFLHSIKNGILYSGVKDIYTKRVFQNSISIKTEEEVPPGALVSINVTTDESSYVGLMGIDERILLDPEYSSSLTEDSIYDKLPPFNAIFLDRGIRSGSDAGLITFSNGQSQFDAYGFFDYGGAGAGGFKPPKSELRTRKLFADTWLFDDFESTSKEGLHLTKFIPDSISSWTITGFSLNPITGLSLTKNTTKLKVFQDFFVSMDLPYVVKEGEILEIPVHVSNYMCEDVLTNVTMNSPSRNLEILESLTSGRTQKNQTSSRVVPSKKKEKFVFLVRAVQAGHYNLTVEAITSLVGDAVQKTLVVEPDGVPYSFSKTYLVDLLRGSQQREDDLSLDIPENIIPHSETIHLSVVGDIFGPLMRNIEKLVRVPFGNSESNMKYFVSNLLVLKYLKTVNHPSPSLESKAKLYLELGYQTQLSFKHLDGSFSLFDRGTERTGDARLTAYIMWALQQAKGFIDIDPYIIDRGLKYLESQQTKNGGFNSGRQLNEDVALTGLSVLAFLVGDNSTTKYQNVINKGMQYLYNVLDDLEEETSIAVSTYALVLGGHDKSKELLKKLSTQAIFKDKHWTKPDTLQSNIQITTYSFMSLLESEETSVESLFPIFRSLISVDKPQATPTYLLALEAMIKFAERIHFEATNCTVHFENDQGGSGDIPVNSSNAQVLQEVQLKSTSRRIKLRTQGKGFALVSLKYKYNLLPENQYSAIYQTNSSVEKSSDRELVLNVCVSKQVDENQSNLTILEVNFQSGYRVDESGYDNITEINEWIKSLELKRSGQSVRVYLENILPHGICVQLGAIKTIAVFNPKPISIAVYDDQNEDQHPLVYYEVISQGEQTNV